MDLLFPTKKQQSDKHTYCKPANQLPQNRFK